MKAVLFCLIRHRTKLEFSFSPYRYRSFSRMIPHSIKSAALPVTKGTANEVPLTTTSPPVPGTAIPTPGAARSGLITSSCLVNPRPENPAYAPVAASYAPTVTTRDAVEGIVKVVSLTGYKKPVPRFKSTPDGIHIS